MRRMQRNINGYLLMNLPIVDPFHTPYKVWKTQKLQMRETLSAAKLFGSDINNELIAQVNNAREAAIYMAKVGADGGLGRFVEDALDNSAAHRHWRNAMPPKTPTELAEYQKNYPICDLAKVSEAINQVGCLLSDAQYLFHGGYWNGGDTLVTNRPLSTSLCPQVALRNSEHNGKAYDVGAIHLFVLRITNPQTKAFVFRRRGTNLGHESEVLLAAGARLELRSQTQVHQEYLVAKWGHPEKLVPAFVLEFDVS